MCWKSDIRQITLYQCSADVAHIQLRFPCLCGQSKNANLKSWDSVDSAFRKRRDVVCLLNRKHPNKTQKRKSSWNSSPSVLDVSTSIETWPSQVRRPGLWGVPGALCYFHTLHLGRNQVRYPASLWFMFLCHFGGICGINLVAIGTFPWKDPLYHHN